MFRRHSHQFPYSRKQHVEPGIVVVLVQSCRLLLSVLTVFVVVSCMVASLYKVLLIVIFRTVRCMIYEKLYLNLGHILIINNFKQTGNSFKVHVFFMFEEAWKIIGFWTLWIVIKYLLAADIRSWYSRYTFPLFVHF